jgi:ABC-type Fe3+-hydroxamate transport system substrate-binding protein
MVVLSLGLAAGAPALAAVVVHDGTGARVSLPHAAARIVSLAPHATELVYAAGAGRKLVGVLAHSDWPVEARALPRVGDAAALDIEGIVALQPDLVVTWPYTVPAQVARLRSFGIAVYTTDARSAREISDDVERLGLLAGTAAAAAPIVADMRARIDALERRRAGARIVRVFYQLGDRPMYTVGSPQLITQALRSCGGANVFGAVDVAAPLVSVEAVLAARPEVILAGTEHARRPAWLDAWQGWPAVPAVRAGNLFVVDAMLLHRPGPRFLEGVEQLCAALERARAALAGKGI